MNTNSSTAAGEGSMARMNPFIVAGAGGAFLGVALGAFGAHVLKATLTEELAATFETAVRYQMYHSLALVALGILVMRTPSRNLIVAGWLFVWGTILFSGSLYALALSHATWLGIITPMGGTLFLAGWAFLIVGVINRRSASSSAESPAARSGHTSAR